MRDPDELVFADGVHADSGGYLLDPLAPDALVELAARDARAADPDETEHLAARARRDAHLGVSEGIDRGAFAETGWGVLFPAVVPGSAEERRQAAIREALEPLLRHRRSQAAAEVERHYREFDGHRGVRPGDSHQSFLERHGVDPGAPADPEAMPYYLLIVGSPREISFSFQVQLDVTYAVGRLDLDTPDEYASYACSVVAAETGPPRRPRELAFFSVTNPDDRATRLAREQLVMPLSAALEHNRRVRGWTLRRHLDRDADKATLARLLGGDATPALLFTASHGVAFDRGDPLQVRRQGALLCDEWQNPRRRAPLTDDVYFSADDIAASADLGGTIVCNFACYGGGTPDLDAYARPGAAERRIADRPFVSGLHRRLLAHPRGGALACVGHLERVWSHSLPTPDGAANRLGVFRGALEVLMKGLPVGAAMEYFGARHARFGADMSATLAALEFAEPEAVEASRLRLVRRWIALNDARDWVVAGDPAVRLRLPGAGPSRSD